MSCNLQVTETKKCTINQEVVTTLSLFDILLLVKLSLRVAVQYNISVLVPPVDEGCGEEYLAGGSHLRGGYQVPR